MLPGYFRPDLTHILFQLHIESRLDFIWHVLNLICLPLADFRVLGLHELRLPPEFRILYSGFFRPCLLPPKCGVLDGNLDDLLSTGLPSQRDLSPCLLDTGFFPGLTNNHVRPASCRRRTFFPSRSSTFIGNGCVSMAMPAKLNRPSLRADWICRQKTLQSLVA